MMHLHTHYKINKIIGLCTVSLGLLTLLMVMISMQNHTTEEGFSARLLPAQQRGTTPWKTLNAEQIDVGYTVPQKTNVIFHLPKTFIKISRRTLFGESGKTIRYWGYCFPKEDNSQTGYANLTGQFFLSEAEQDFIDAEQRARRNRQVFEQGKVSQDNLNLSTKTQGRVQHQKDTFLPGETCFIMAEAPLPIGLDRDNDLANDRVEKTHGTDPNDKDTDKDGILDGIEIFKLKTQPLVRDTDGDGLIDGMEDKNRNGNMDQGETSPLHTDSDGDGLCDGFCRRDNGQSAWGEDRNVNGIVDDGETDPLKEDTDGDGILDEQEYFLCKLQGGCA